MRGFFLSLVVVAACCGGVARSARLARASEPDVESTHGFTLEELEAMKDSAAPKIEPKIEPTADPISADTAPLKWKVGYEWHPVAKNAGCSHCGDRNCTCQRRGLECQCDFPGKCLFLDYLGAVAIVVKDQDGDATVTRVYRPPFAGKSITIYRSGSGENAHWTGAAWASAADVQRATMTQRAATAVSVGSSSSALTPNADSQLVIAAGRAAGAKSILTGQPNQILQAAAEYQAGFLASNNSQSLNGQGHPNWDARHAHLVAALPGFEISEISAESWPRNSREESAPEMFITWAKSAGHNRVANWTGALYGYSMARGSNGIYYGVGIMARPMPGYAAGPTAYAGVGAAVPAYPIVAARILHFTADWCVPCRTMAPIVARLRSEGRDIEAVNFDTDPRVQQYSVKAIPCFIAIDAAGNEVDRQKGVCSETRLRALALTMRMQPQVKQPVIYRQQSAASCGAGGCGVGVGSGSCCGQRPQRMQQRQRGRGILGQGIY